MLDVSEIISQDEYLGWPTELTHHPFGTHEALAKRPLSYTTDHHDKEQTDVALGAADRVSGPIVTRINDDSILMPHPVLNYFVQDKWIAHLLNQNYTSFRDSECEL